MNRTHLLLMAAALAAPIALAPRAAAEPPSPEGDPRDIIERNYEVMRTMALEAKDHDALTARVTGVVDGMADWRAFSAKTLTCRVWDELSEEQKERFIRAYRAFIVDRYARHFEPGLRFEVTFRGPTEFSELRDRAEVRTTVTVPREDGPDTGADVDYLFVATKQDDRLVWKIEDIVTDTVSRALTYRPRFVRIYRERGFDTLVEAIERNVRSDD
ncbi:MAG: MlaC/ttg2D family ABC transporter substrate-binding protein [Myxococcota bacterium]